MTTPRQTRESTQAKSLHALCPHCATPGAVRSSRQITPVYKQFYIACRNMLCGHTWLAELHVVHSITPSAVPDPSLHIRMGPTMAQLIRASADTRINGPPANDDDAARLQG
ncbi:MAG: ogr/Delta-like zinc finger family protein [Sphingobium sp.]|uniref:ogr/Delta-like zinc finger family protein n=1 Tax=Sphingobium sp. TaxID=1912891 RepID=UPI003BAE82B5